MHIAQTYWIEKVERSYIARNPLATTMRERLKMRPDGTAHRDDFYVHLHEGSQIVLDIGSIFSPAGDCYRDGVILIFKVCVEEINEAGKLLFNCPQGQASNHVIDNSIFQSSHYKFLLDLSSTLL